MKMAYVSYEFPVETAFGGIATYVQQVAAMMRNRGHTVEIFCGSNGPSRREDHHGLAIHRVQGARRDFAERVLPVFRKRHEEISFDLVESPEYGGDAYFIKMAFPTLPLVVKLHTPTFLVDELNGRHRLRGWAMAGPMLAAIWQGKVKGAALISLFARVFRASSVAAIADRERALTQLADEVHSPSVSLGNLVAQRWHLDAARVWHVPNVFVPSPALLNVVPAADSRTVTFVGRLEIRKGVIGLLRAIPDVCREFPDVRFRFVGQSLSSILPGVLMDDYIRLRLKDYVRHLEFTRVEPAELPDIFSDTAVAVFPSIWENFPNTCLEAMSAGCAIVGSVHGGMKEMLEHPVAGILVDPVVPGALSRAIIELLKKPDLRAHFGNIVRRKVLTTYNEQAIGQLLEERYTETISASKEARSGCSAFQIRKPTK